jgi:hypothetical protein
MWSYQAHDYCRCNSSIFIANEIHTFFFEVGNSHTVKLVGSKYFINEIYKHELIRIESNSKEE